MTTSEETEFLNFPVLRRLVDEANNLPIAERVTLLKGLIPRMAETLTPDEFRGLIAELLLKGERLYDAIDHPGQGRSTRQVPGEREIEGR